MCTWYYAEEKSLSFFIEKAQRLPLAHSIMNAMVKPAKMSGNIRPTDMAAVIVPNKSGNMNIYQMIWGFTHESFKKPLINCRVMIVSAKEIWLTLYIGNGAFL